MLEEALEKYFGYPSFRFNQKQIVQSILSHRDTLAILPTGGGKSICYQLPALLLEGLTLVISPLISLMKDQIDTLHLQNIEAGLINSTMTDEAYRSTLFKLRTGKLKLLYIAPERLQNEYLITVLSSIEVSQIAIDEAHCVSQWGHDFRPSYREIRKFINQLNQQPVISAFTATATQKVQEDIVNQLGLVNPFTVVNSFDRPNIRFSVVEPHDKYQTLKTYLSEKESIIIYAQTRKSVDQLCSRLVNDGFKAGRYHAGMTAQERQQAQENFIYDRYPIMVATNAFGMGIDKTDVRKVIHYNLPTDLEGYYQEAGRAGRDGLEAEAILFFAKQDIITAKFLVENSEDPNRGQRLQTMIQYANYTSCLRQFILRYFGENSKPCHHCSGCFNEFETIEVTQEAQMILSTIIRTKQQFGMSMIANILHGSKEKKILDWQFNELSTYGLLKNQALSQIKDIISALVAEQFITINEHRGLIVTEKSRKLLSGESQLSIKLRKTKLSSKPPQTTLGLNAPADNTLYELLREKRAEIASQLKLPPYIIFSNRTLADMTRKLPVDYQSFLKVEGVGEVKANHYYQDFTQVIRSYIE